MPLFLVFGPNMAAVFRSGVRFDPSIGPRSSSYRCCSVVRSPPYSKYSAHECCRAMVEEEVKAMRHRPESAKR
jgi:hypothetical protein